MIRFNNFLKFLKKKIILFLILYFQVNKLNYIIKGDGIVAARHLKHYGYDPVLLLPTKKPEKEFFKNLLTTCEMSNIPMLEFSDITESLPYQVDFNFTLVVDAIFGFSFKPPIRPPYDKLI